MTFAADYADKKEFEKIFCRAHELQIALEEKTEKLIERFQAENFEEIRERAESLLAKHGFSGALRVLRNNLDDVEVYIKSIDWYAIGYLKNESAHRNRFNVIKRG